MKRQSAGAFVAAFVAAIIAWGCELEHGHGDGELGAIDSPISQQQACSALGAFHQTYEIDQVACDNGLIETYRTLLAQCGGQPANHYQQDFDALLAAHPIAAHLTPEQIEAWRELYHLSRGRVRIVWDEHRLSPSRIDFGLQLLAGSAAAGRAALDGQVAMHVAALLRLDPEDAQIVEDVRDRSLAPPGGGEPLDAVALPSAARRAARGA